MKTNAKYSGYGIICFDTKGKFNFGDSLDAKNLMILGVDMTPYYPSTSLSEEERYTKNSKIYVLGKDFIRGFSADGGGRTIKVQKLYKTNFTEPNKKFVLSLHYNGDNSYLFIC